jgi:hypothetical protein
MASSPKPGPSPFVRKALNECPLEDCGGSPGFAVLLEAASNPDHERHLEMQPWLSERAKEVFDRERLDLALMNKVLKWVAQDLRRHAPCR